MFCPNCGSENEANQNYCRLCGLKLDAVAEFMAEQFPSKEYAVIQRRKKLFERVGMFSLSVAGIIGLAFLVFAAAYFKLILLGPEVLFGSALIALTGFLLLAIFFLGYPKLFMKTEKLNSRLLPRENVPISSPTKKFLEEKPIEPIPSVTESSTELLEVPAKRRD